METHPYLGPFAPVAEYNDQANESFASRLLHMIDETDEEERQAQER